MVEGQHRKAMWINKKLLMIGRDIFGCDLIAKRRYDKTLWVQVSTKVNKGKKIKQVTDYPWNTAFDRIQVWCRLVGQKAYEVYEYPNWNLVGIWYVNWRNQ